ncbi:AcrR family transcriptional regulator [Methanomicrobium sp. W14]|uniref:TetR/AcrR family transcriptional regulator n=1 Tax=Methanomicrobium sp. W14 TaxID=2817839 RepID=UPI001AE747A8|nr:TetR/AcrR family transcriptional regulator [Methanomicrobium sp. W14]MBP2133307.1 AcrR family transcriptional regulator [Methanomicrobium sp. W14]
MPRVMPGYREKARLKILEKAYLVFSKKGFYNTTMDDIAIEVGVTKGTLYLYFKSKEELFRAMADQYSSGFTENILKKFENKNFTENSGLFFDIYFRMNSGSEPLIYELASISTRNEEIKKMLFEETAKDKGQFLKFFEMQVKKGYLPKDTDIKMISAVSGILAGGLMERIYLGMSKKEARMLWTKTIEKLVK